MTHVFEIRSYGHESHELSIDGKGVQLEFFILEAAMLYAEFIACDMAAANTRWPHQAATNLDFAPPVRRDTDFVEIRRAMLVLPGRRRAMTGRAREFPSLETGPLNQAPSMKRRPV